MGVAQTLSLDENGILIEKAINDIYDSMAASLACIITGHCHRNYSIISEKGYPIIATTCDTGGLNSEYYDPDTPNRIVGTTAEQVIDLYSINTVDRYIKIIRIGAGDSVMDRSFSY